MCLFFIFAAGTPYAGGHFNMKLVLGKNFPQEPPKGYFLTKVFHPNVASNGEICVNTLKKDWKAELGIKHVLLVCHFKIFKPPFLCQYFRRPPFFGVLISQPPPLVKNTPKASLYSVYIWLYAYIF